MDAATAVLLTIGSLLISLPAAGLALVLVMP